MALSHPDGADWIARNWNDELLPYNFEWVAATGDGLLASSHDLDEVFAEVANDDRREEIVFAFVWREVVVERT